MAGSDQSPLDPLDRLIDDLADEERLEHELRALDEIDAVALLAELQEAERRERLGGFWRGEE